jgi:diguanylate cyclase (GGDEF)-like protein
MDGELLSVRVAEAYRRGDMTQTTPVSSTSELHTELRDLGSRDLQLWSIGALVLVVVALGFLCLVVPNLMWKTNAVKIESRYLPQLFSGFIVLVALFNVYLLDQKRRLNNMRDSLVRRLLLTDYSDKSSFRDHLTNAFNREYALAAIERERKRAGESRFSVLMIDVVDFRKINHKYGNLAGDHLLLVAAQLIRSTFRGADIVCRFGGDEFVIVMPDTTPEQCVSPITRLVHAARAWNENTELSYTLEFRCGLVDGSAATSTNEMLEELFVKTRGDRNLPMLIALPHVPAEALHA